MASDFIRQVELGVPLAPNLWESGDEKFCHWHFVSLSDTWKANRDILKALIEYGISFLEDPDAANETWQRWGITSFKNQNDGLQKDIIMFGEYPLTVGIL